MAKFRKFCVNKLSTKVNLQAFRFPAVFRLVVALGNRLKETILIRGIPINVTIAIQAKKILKKFELSVPISYAFGFAAISAQKIGN